VIVKTIAMLLALAFSLPAIAQEAPQSAQRNTLAERYPQLPITPEQVARPGGGGNIAGDVKLQLVKVADGLYDPVNVVSANDGSGRLFVVERSGRIVIVKDGKVLEEPFLDITDIVLQAMLEQGMYDIAFHPDFAENGKFYAHYAELMRNGDSVIVEYRVSKDSPDRADPDSARLIMQIEQPWANHNGGEIEFGPDGYLYIGSGDGGWEGDPLEAGQDLSTLLGKILRIDVNVSEGSYDNYAIPGDNPFAEKAGLIKLFGISEEVFAKIHTEARPEIWAYGLRNPWKFHFDPKNGDMYIAEVGQNHWEEIDLLPAGAKGLNYGWDLKMGTQCFPISEKDCADVGVLPIAEYPHEGGSCAVIGIGVARAKTLSRLDGAYLFGDYCSGKIWATVRDDKGWKLQQLLDTELQLTGSGTDQDGNLYVTSCKCTYGQREATATGSLWRLVRADQVPRGAETAPTSKQQQGQNAQAPKGDGAGRDNRAQAGGRAAAPGAAGADDAPMRRGQEVFTANCAVCHGPKGKGTIGPALGGNKSLQNAEHVVTQIHRGGGAMPAFADQLTPQQIAAVATYIRNAWGNDFGAVDVRQVKKITGGGGS
jgi:glucose/arabinose dehydrogenase/mono/diheme cytochrome c family protein